MASSTNFSLSSILWGKNNPLNDLTGFAKEIRKPKEYSPGISEFTGICNLGIGFGQVLSSPFIKSQSISQMHYKNGIIALRQGVMDLAPPAAIITSLLAIKLGISYASQN